MAAVKMHVEGLRQLGENMRTLNRKISTGICSRATGKGAQVFKRRAKANLKANPSTDSGLLEKNVIIKKLPKRDSKLTSEHITTVRKRQYPDDPDTTRRVGVFVEWGTLRMPAEPFMRPAFDSGTSEAITVVKEELTAGIAKATEGMPS